MKNKTLSTLLFSLSLFSSAHAITVDEIIDGYLENIGGKEAISKLHGIKMSGEMNQGGMKFPIQVISLSDGRQYMQFSFQGKDLKQGVFDGKTMWNTNFLTMQAEKADAESTENQKLEMNDFPFPLFNYKEKGYELELLGTEEKDGADTYKLKLTREQKTVDGKKVDDISFYYFDVDALVPISTESEIKEGPMKGKIGESKLSDYQEVDGLYFPFSLSQGLKDGPSMSMVIKKIELNPVVQDSEFDFPVAEKKEIKEIKGADKKSATSKVN